LTQSEPQDITGNNTIEKASRVRCKVIISIAICASIHSAVVAQNNTISVHEETVRTQWLRLSGGSRTGKSQQAIELEDPRLKAGWDRWQQQVQELISQEVLPQLNPLTQSLHYEVYFDSNGRVTDCRTYTPLIPDDTTTAKLPTLSRLLNLEVFPHFPNGSYVEGVTLEVDFNLATQRQLAQPAHPFKLGYQNSTDCQMSNAVLEQEVVLDREMNQTIRNRWQSLSHQLQTLQGPLNDENRSRAEANCEHDIATIRAEYQKKKEALESSATFVNNELNRKSFASGEQSQMVPNETSLHIRNYVNYGEDSASRQRSAQPQTKPLKAKAQRLVPNAE
jgi:hypothetical protein